MAQLAPGAGGLVALTPAGLALATVHLVRHGETLWNAEGRVQGWIDVPLGPAGVAQADELAARLSVRPVGAIISSDLARAHATATAIAGPHGLPVRAETALRERRYGVMEGRLYDEGRAEYGGRWEVLLRGVEDHFAGGESTRQHYDRVAVFMAALLAAPPAEEIVIVSHGGTVRRLYSYLRGGFSHEYRLPITNCSVMTLRARPDGSFARAGTG